MAQAVPIFSIPLPKTRWEGWQVWVFGLLLGITAVLYAYLLLRRETLINSDFLSFSERMMRMDREPWQKTWVDGLYPVGYPLLIRSLEGWFGGYAEAARWVSWMSGLAGLVAVWQLSRRVAGDTFALLVTLFTAGNHWYMTFSTSEGTDLPALALGLWAVALPASPRQGWAKWVLIGGVLGLGYLVRYTSLLLLPAIFLAWALQPGIKIRELAKQAAWVTGAFLIVSAPQWVASWVLMGSPLYNTQHWNVLHAIQNDGKWYRIMAEGHRYPNLGAVIAHVGWGAFLKNFALNLYRLVRFDLFYFPLHLLWVVGAGLLLWRRERAGLLAVLVFGLTAAAVSITFLSPRVLILDLPLQILLGLFPLVALLQTWPVAQKAMLAVLAMAGLGLAYYWYTYTYVIAQTPSSKAQLELMRVLEREGYRRPQEVLSFSLNQYTAGKPRPERFSMPWTRSGVTLSDPKQVADMARAGCYEFVVMDTLSAADVEGFSTWYGKRWPPLRLIRDPVLKAGGVWLFRIEDSARRSDCP